MATCFTLDSTELYVQIHVGYKMQCDKTNIADMPHN